MSRGKPGRASQLRLSSGLWRGRRLRIGPGVRPTESKVREALFSIWQQRIPEAKILDLFAGSGAVGFEAIGRGASKAVLVESSAKVLAVLRGNAQALIGDASFGAESKVNSIVLKKGVLPGWLTVATGTPIAGPYDLIFADPPYRFTEFVALLHALPDWLAREGQLVIEHSSRVELPAVDDLTIVDQRAYGESCLTFFERCSP